MMASSCQVPSIEHRLMHQAGSQCIHNHEHYDCKPEQTSFVACGSGDAAHTSTWAVCHGSASTVLTFGLDQDDYCTLQVIKALFHALSVSPMLPTSATRGVVACSRMNAIVPGRCWPDHHQRFCLAHSRPGLQVVL